MCRPSLKDPFLYQLELVRCPRLEQLAAFSLESLAERLEETLRGDLLSYLLEEPGGGRSLDAILSSEARAEPPAALGAT